MRRHNSDFTWLRKLPPQQLKCPQKRGVRGHQHESNIYYPGVCLLLPRTTREHILCPRSSISSALRHLSTQLISPCAMSVPNIAQLSRGCHCAAGTCAGSAGDLALLQSQNSARILPTRSRLGPTRGPALPGKIQPLSLPGIALQKRRSWKRLPLAETLQSTARIRTHQTRKSAENLSEESRYASTDPQTFLQPIPAELPRRVEFLC